MEHCVLDMLTVVDPAKVSPQGVAWVQQEIKMRCAAQDSSYSTNKWRAFLEIFFSVRGVER